MYASGLREYTPPPSMADQLDHAKKSLIAALPWALGIGALWLFFGGKRYR
jgi:hypothetical protein